MTTYTTTADANGDFNLSFGSTAYTGGESIKVKATSGTSEREIIINAPSELIGLAGIRFEGDYVNFPSANLKMIISGVKNILANAFWNGNNTIFSKVTRVEMDGTCESLADYVFYNMKMTSIQLSANLKTIGGGALYGCNELLSFVMPNTVTALGESALLNCTKITNLVISTGLKTIPSSCFSGLSQLPSVTFPASIISISANACQSWGACNEITMLPATPPTITSTTFYGLKSTCVFKVPAGSVDAYKTAANWSAFASRIQAI